MKNLAIAIAVTVLTSAPALAMGEIPGGDGLGGATKVPEPGMMGIFGMGLAAVAYARMRRRA